MSQPHPDSSAQPPADGAEGVRIAGYEVLGRIGKGGMGTVHEARQISMDRPVALKILAQRLADSEEFVARFLREARSAAKLRHPHIVQAIDVGQAEGCYYFAMELVDGEGLSALVRRDGPPDQEQALRWMKQVCSALVAAHKAGIVHRDIKPSNVLVDREGQVRVADFGLAHELQDEAGLTADGKALGTPGYVAPEIARGGEGDARSDLYSLGATFFHVLAGRPPFEGQTSGQTVLKQVSEPAPALAEAAPGVDRRLCRIIDRLLAREPEARYPSAQALLDELEALGTLRRRPTAAPTAPARARRAEVAFHPRRRGRHQSIGALVGSVVVAAVMVGLVVLVVTRPTDRGGGQGAEARAAFEAAVAYRAERPDDVEGAIERYEGVAARFPGTAWASRASEKVTELEEMQAQGPKGKGGFHQALSALRDEVSGLTGRDRFGAALERIDAFRAEHPDGADAARRLSKEVLRRAERRYRQLAENADKAARQKDFDAARDAVRPALGFGLPAFAKRARRKLGQINDRQEHAEQYARWEAIRMRSDKLAKQERWDDAVAVLDEATELPLPDVKELIAEQTQAVQAARKKALGAARADYRRRADEVWDLFRQRRYDAARRLLDRLATDPATEGAADLLAADRQAADLLGEFWDQVEGGVGRRVGRQLAIDGPVGRVKGVEDGVVTLSAGGVEIDRHVHRMTTDQAVGMADLTDDRRERLLLGVFLLAEGKRLEEAGEALAAAGDDPAVRYYRRRLHDLRHDAEALAERARDERPGGWYPLFDGRSLAGWRVVRRFPRRGEGGRVVADAGKGMIGFWESGGLTGIVWDGEFPTDRYEVRVEAMRVKGGGRFCDIHFPVGGSHCVVQVGEGYVGLDLVNGQAARRNGTAHRGRFHNGRWYTLGLRVSPQRIEVEVDGERVVDVARDGARFSTAPWYAALRPFGISSHRTRAAYRAIELRRMGD
ncbi:MAG: protein kinase domain-containing protein [bacterium]